MSSCIYIYTYGIHILCIIHNKRSTHYCVSRKINGVYLPTHANKILYLRSGDYFPNTFDFWSWNGDSCCVGFRFQTLQQLLLSGLGGSILWGGSILAPPIKYFSRNIEKSPKIFISQLFNWKCIKDIILTQHKFQFVIIYK